jgi:uncharacterized OB-fold protein
MMDRWVYPTTGLHEKDFETGQVLVETWKGKAEYAWDAGIGIGQFLEALRRGRLIGRHCPSCRRILFPPRMFCEQCFRPTAEWVGLSDTGTVLTYSVVHVRWDMVRLQGPQVPAVIAVDGASPGMGILHLLGGVAPERVRMGMRVRAVWKPPEEREGSITDIRYFAPLG